MPSQMSLCIFASQRLRARPALLPQGPEELTCRWWSLLGTAVTLGSIAMFINFLGTPNQPAFSRPGQPWRCPLEARVATGQGRRRHGRVPKRTTGLPAIHWIPNFNIEYYLGIDGISMPLILLTTLLFFLSMIASWNITKIRAGLLHAVPDP